MRGAVPSTVTDSLDEPINSCTVPNPVSFPTSTVRFFDSKARKFGASIFRSYAPGGRSRSAIIPAEVVWVVNTRFVARCVTVTLALATTAPCGSCTTPETVPVTIPCAGANVAPKTRVANATAKQILPPKTDLITFSLVPLERLTHECLHCLVLGTIPTETRHGNRRGKSTSITFANVSPGSVCKIGTVLKLCELLCQMVSGRVPTRIGKEWRRHFGENRLDGGTVKNCVEGSEPARGATMRSARHLLWMESAWSFFPAEEGGHASCSDSALVRRHRRMSRS